MWIPSVGCTDRAGSHEAPLHEEPPHAASAGIGMDDKSPEPRPARRKVAPALENDVRVERDRADNPFVDERHVGLGDAEPAANVEQLGQVRVDDPVGAAPAVAPEARPEEVCDRVELVLAGEADRDAPAVGIRARAHPDPLLPLLRRCEAVHGSERA